MGNIGFNERNKTMTREQAKELLPIIQAFAEGKIIQDKIEGLTDWCDTDEINLQYEGQKIKHRVKPEPKYRPFRTKEECWNEMQKHQPFGWVISKLTEDYTTIGSITKFITFNITFTTNENDSFTAEFLFEKYKFADGTPFGIKEE